MSGNPLRDDPSFAAARDLIAAGGLGQTLAVYAAARARDPLPDPLTTLGLPLLDELIATAGEAPGAVTALRGGEPDGFAHWSLVLAFPSGLRATVDLGAGVGPGQMDALELRVEWSGTARALLIEPGAVAVTVTTGRGAARHSAEVSAVTAALLEPAAVDAAWGAATEIVAAARRSAEIGERVAL
jgi:hypothetical protein